MQKSYNKAFGIGLSRTATVSLTIAFRQLGLTANHCPLIYKNSSLAVKIKLLINRFYIYCSKRFLNRRAVVFNNTYSINNELHLSPKLIDQYDAFADTPIAYFYKDLDKLYQDSKFILTVREMDSWLASCKRHFKPEYTGGLFDQLNYNLYGTNIFEEDKFVNAYERHIRDVKIYFNDRENDLLVLDVCAGDGFEKLCPFLDLPLLDQSFPHRRH